MIVTRRFECHIARRCEALEISGELPKISVAVVYAHTLARGIRQFDQRFVSSFCNVDGHPNGS